MIKGFRHSQWTAFWGTSFALAACASLLLSTANAHPYASGITNKSGTISYVLNENADDVQVIFNNGVATNNQGAVNRGVHTFSLGAYTNYSIVVSKTGLGFPSKISVDATNDCFYGPRGVAVNVNPKNHNFGRVYVANANSGNDASLYSYGRSTTRGIFVINADMSDALGYNATGKGLTGVTLGSSTTFAPYRISVGPDDSVYFTDASGSPSGGGSLGGGAVWKVDPDLVTSTAVFKFGLGGTTNFGPCISRAVVTGSTSTANMILYGIMWNYTNAAGHGYNDVFKYTINNGPLPWNTAPIPLANAGANVANGVIDDLDIAPDGKFFVMQSRSSATGGNVSLSVYDTDGTTLLWDSSTAGGGVDPFVNSLSVAVSPDGQCLATATSVGSGRINVCQLVNGLPDLGTFTTFNYNSTSAASSVRGVAFDAADNVYAVSGSTGGDVVRAFSLGLSTIATTRNDITGTNGTFQIATPATAPLIGVQPQNQTIYIGSPATFSVTASSSSTVGYQWQFASSNLSDNPQISGTQDSTLTLYSPTPINAGDYRVILTNANGATTSAVATLTVLSPGSFPVGWSQLPSSPGNTVRHDDIYFTDFTNGWASQNPYLYHTTNGGFTWTTNFTAPGAHFRSVSFASRKVGFAGNLGVGSYDGGVTDTNVLYATFDGGITWSNVPGFAEAGMKGLCAMSVLDSQHIYGAGRVRGPAFFIKTENGGTNWSIVNLTAAGIMNGLMDVYFQDPTNGWVVGMDTNAYASPPYYGRIARTTNGGATWTTVLTTPVASSYFWKMAWPSKDVGYVSLQQNASFNNVIFYKTTDGGNTWVSNGIPLSSLGLGPSAFYLQGIGFVSTNEGWIGGAASLGYPYSFLHTKDGGLTWEPAGYNDSYRINRIRFLNPNIGYASGETLSIYYMPLVITEQPQSQVVMNGSNVNLSVKASSLTPITYQWQKDGVSIAATNSTLSFNSVTRQVEGTYSVSLTNTDAASLTSSNATVRILAAERLSAPVLLPGGQLRLLFEDADGGPLLTTNDIPTFQVLVSTNLVDWTVITNALSITNGSMLLEDTWTNSPSRFYKVLEH